MNHLKTAKFDRYNYNITIHCLCSSYTREVVSSVNSLTQLKAMETFLVWLKSPNKVNKS